MKVSIVFNSSGAAQTVGQTQQIQQALAQVGSTAVRVVEQTKGVGTSVTELAFKFNNVVQAVQSLAAAAKPAYDLLIGQNEKLNQQLLGARANLVATNKILKDGVEVADSTDAIKALDAPVKAAVDQIRIASLDVVGVTSGQLIEVFNILTAQASSLNQQSKELPNSIDAAAKLTTDFAAALGTIGLPLGLARQEISSILSGMIDQNSVLAKQLGITNQQVNEWKTQGVLVDEMRKRLEPFVEGNKLAARSISGITSNIQEILEITAQAAGEPLLAPLVDALDEFYQFLKENQEEIKSFSQDAVLKFLDLAQAVGDAALRIGEALLPSLEALAPAAEIAGDLLVTGFKASAEALVKVTEFLEPLIWGLAKIISLTAQLIETSQTGFGYITGSYNESVQAAETYAGITAQLSQEAIASNQKLREALKARNAAQAMGVNLSKEQLAAENQARQSQASLVAQLKQYRTELLNANLVGAENKESVKAQVREIENQIKVLEKLGGQFKNSSTQVTIQAKDLKNLGNTYQQLKEKADSARKSLADGAGGDSNRANQAAKELISLTEQRRQLGQISAAQAIKEIEAVRTNTKISFEQQVAAAEAITKIKKGQGDRQVADIKTQQQQTQTLIESGQLSQAEGERRLTNLKQQELETRLKLTRDAIARERKEGRGNGDTAKELVQQERQLQAELSTIRSQGTKKQLAETLKDFDEQKTILDAKFAQRLISEQEYNNQSLKLTLGKFDEELKQVKLQRQKLAKTDIEGLEAATAKEAEIRAKRAKFLEDTQKKSQDIQLRELEKSLAKASAIVKEAETSRLTEIQRLLNQGIISQKEAENLRLDVKRQSIEDDLRLEKQRLDKLLSLPKFANPEDEEKRQNKIQASRQRTADLTLQLLQNEYDQQQQTKEAAIKAIEERAAAQKRASDDITASLEKEKSSYEAIEKSLENSIKLLESRSSLQKALSNLQQAQGQIELDTLDKALAIRRDIDKAENSRVNIFYQKALNELGIKGAVSEMQASERRIQLDYALKQQREEIQRAQEKGLITELGLIYKKQELEDKLAQQKREAALAEQERQKQSLALELQKNEIAAQRLVIEAKIAENQAKQNLNSAQENLAKAQKNPQDKTAIANAEQSVKLAQQGVELAAQGVKNAEESLKIQPELAKNAQAVLEATQKAEKSQLDFADKAREAAQAMELAAFEAKRWTEALNKGAADEKNRKSDNTPTPTSRFTGGPISAGQPYLVGDGPGGQVIPGVSEIIVPGTSSYVLSARKVAELMTPPSTSMSISPSPVRESQQLIKEIQGLRQDLKNRKPINQNQFTFNRQGDEIDALYQVMDMIRTTMPL